MEKSPIRKEPNKANLRSLGILTLGTIGLITTLCPVLPLVLLDVSKIRDFMNPVVETALSSSSFISHETALASAIGFLGMINIK